MIKFIFDMLSRASIKNKKEEYKTTINHEYHKIKKECPFQS